MGKFNLVWIRVAAFAVPLTAAGPALAQSAGGSAPDYSKMLFGDAGGLRTTLGKYGISLAVNDSENLLGNLSGGVKTGATIEGVTTASLEIDTDKAIGLVGGTFHISALQIHGQSLSGPYLDNLQAANGNEGEDGTRLWEIWYDQQFDNNTFDVKIGQQSIDNEFITSTYSGLFVNTMAGWPLIPSVDLYGGGPAYPLSSLGARVQAEPTGNTTILAGVFDDNPGGGAFTDDAQYLDRNGGKFNLNTGALFIGELQYATKVNGLAGTYKIGSWFDSGKFSDQRFDTNGVSLGSPFSNGMPKNHHGNYSMYGVADQTVWQSARTAARSLNVFGRIMGAPDYHNLVDFSFNGGITLSAPLPGRDNDQAGIDFGIGRVSSRAAALERELRATRQTTEELVEFTYQAQATPWLLLQPDLQYVIHPGAGIADPNDPTHDLRDEVIAGARAIVTF